MRPLSLLPRFLRPLWAFSLASLSRLIPTRRNPRTPATPLNSLAPNTATYAPDIYSGYAYDAHARVLARTHCHSVTKACPSPDSRSAAPACYDYENAVALNRDMAGHEIATPRPYTYGEPAAPSSCDAQNIGSYFTDRAISTTYAPTGVRYCGFRYYNPTTGHWLSRDPIEEADGPNMHAMVGNNPTNVVDIDGRTGWAFNDGMRPIPHPRYNLTNPLQLGFLSYYRGVYRMARFTFRYCGCSSDSEQRAAEIELTIATLVAKEVLTNAELRNLAVDPAKKYAEDDPFRILGRAGAGVGTSLLLTRYGGKSGRAAGMVLSATAAAGDMLYQCETGLKLLKENYPQTYETLGDSIQYYNKLSPEDRKRLIEKVTEGFATGGK